jgi:septal ring factor EnvC (AmiA/AmiB activator)
MEVAIYQVASHLGCYDNYNGLSRIEYVRCQSEFAQACNGPKAPPDVAVPAGRAVLAETFRRAAAQKKEKITDCERRIAEMTQEIAGLREKIVQLDRESSEFENARAELELILARAGP